MSLLNVVSLLGGLALFLFGMTVMSNGLEKISGGRMEAVLEKMTDNIIKSVLLGTLVTAAIQSSSATTVIVVGLVNAKILKLRQAIGIIMGANIGTTVTAHILRLSELENSTLVIFQYIKPTTLAPLAAIVGILLYLAAKKSVHREIGMLLLGFSVLFTGMFSMEAAVAPLSGLPQFGELFSKFSNPILGVLVGTVVTAIIQSSSASVGILQALASTGVITFASAFPIIMGQNIGTCITPVLASVGASKNAKRTAFVHVSFNVIGTIFFLCVIYLIQWTVGFYFWNDPIGKGGIANFHTIFNLTVTILLLPFAKLLEKMACFFVKNDSAAFDEEDFSALDDRFLTSPGFAISQARETVVNMAQLSLENYNRSVALAFHFDKKQLERAREVENVIDRLQSKVDIYLMKLSQRDLNDTENLLLSEVLQVVNEFERIGDHADNICDCASNMHEGNVTLSDNAIAELKAVTDAVREIVELAVEGYTKRDSTLAQTIEPLEEVINILVETLKVRHSDRLQSGLCSINSAFPFVEILYNLERTADHCSNVGVHIISYSGANITLDRHEYLRDLHRAKTEDYQAKFNLYDKKYFGRLEEIEHDKRPRKNGNPLEE